jgi:hypothetical protein
MIVRSRRLATTLALALTAGGTTIAVAGPAQAAPMDCGQVVHSLTVTSTYITATYSISCDPDGQARPIEIYKNGVEVASGSGIVFYECVGSAESSFLVIGYTDNSFEAACG